MRFMLIGEFSTAAVSVANVQAGRARVTEQAHSRIVRHARPQHALDLATSCVARVQDPTDPVRRLSSERECARGITIELNTPGHQLFDAGHAFFDQDADRRFLAQAIAGGHRVGEMFFR